MSESTRVSTFISIAIPFCNNQETLSSAIKSILHQTYTNFELLLLDDGSSDGSLRIAQDFNDPRIQVFSDGKNLGLPARLNQSVQLARGMYYARMDADDICYPGRLSKQVDFLEENPDIDLLGCGAVVFDNKGGAIGLFPMKITHEQIVSSPLKGFYLPHPTWMGRTEWFRKHPYNERSLKAQDQELLLRSYCTSHFACLNEVLLGYRQEKMTFTKALKGRYYFSRALADHAFSRRSYLKGVTAITVQSCKAGYDFLTLQCGLEKFISSHRTRSITSTQEKEWQMVWNSVK